MIDDRTDSPRDSGVELNEPPEYTPPIPHGSQAWKDCDAGLPEAWPTDLKSYVATIAGLDYPAAVLYAEEFLLLHNQAWADASGSEQQGCKQRGRLSADVWHAFQCGLRGNLVHHITSGQILRVEGDPADDKYAVSISPLRRHGEKHAASLLVQLFPKQSSKDDTMKDALDGSCDDSIVASASKESLDSGVPLDEHPFFHRFGEMLPCGLAILDRDAEAVYVNQVFYAMTTHRESNQAFYGWPQSIHPDDKERVLDAYRDAFKKQQTLRTEFRTKADDSNSWRLLLLTPLGDENLRHVSLRQSGGFLCCIVDISSEKAAELTERKAAQEADERRSALTSFIDMISHEIRNPLSAVLHCSEDISEALQEHPIGIASIKDAVETINVCIAHQKNIVDDVLSFSKLDASMLTLVPSRCRPAADIAELLKLFQPELRKSHIDFSFGVDDTYHDSQISWALADMPRIGQVLINLMSNAIKFTARGEGEKRISVSVGASVERPASYPSGVVSFNLDEPDFHMDTTNNKDWGHGESLYIEVAVQDTGIGISELDQQKLFERFRQATPKTAETYGGSGLGLNISRKLCQLHGGEIGVSANEGIGSTFAFFFKIKRDNSGETTQGKNQAANEDAYVKNLRKLESIPTKLIDRGSALATSKKSTWRAENSDPRGGEDRCEHGESVKREVPQNQDVGVSKRSQTFESAMSGISDESKTRATPAESHGLRILLVEDNIINQRILQKRLRSKEFQVTTANNGREAVDTASKATKDVGKDQQAFDIILMDNEMPILDGNGATKELRNMERKGDMKKIPILGVTANVRGAQQDAMLECGMDDVISKPYRIEDIVKRIEKIVEASRSGMGKSEDL